jgi:hypothetical protein
VTSLPLTPFCVHGFCSAWHFDHALHKKLKKHDVGQEITDTGPESSEDEEAAQEHVAQLAI